MNKTTILEFIKQVEDFEGFTVEKELSYEVPKFELNIKYNNEVLYKVYPTYPKRTVTISPELEKEFRGIDDSKSYYKLNHILDEYSNNNLYSSYKNESKAYKGFLAQEIAKVPEEFHNIYKILFYGIEEYKRYNSVGILVKLHVKERVEEVSKELKFLESLECIPKGIRLGEK